MEIIQKYGVLKNNHFCLYDNFNDTMEVEFRKLKGRYYKKNNFWSFPKDNIPNVSKEEVINEYEEVSVQTDHSIAEEHSTYEEVSVQTEPSNIEKNITTKKYKYNPPDYFYDYIKEYI